MDDGRSKVLTWRKSGAGSVIDDGKSVASSTRSLTQNALVLANSAPKSVAPAPSVASRAPTLQRSVTAPVTSGLAYTTKSSGDISTKTLIGTLLGAAAGAAIGYAMCKTEEDSAREEAKAYAAEQARIQRMVEAARSSAPALPPPQQAPQQQIAYAPSQISVSRQIEQAAYYPASEYGGAAASSPPQYRAIEAPPPKSHYAHSYVSGTGSEASRQRALEYYPPPIPTVQTVYTAAPSRARSIAGESTLIKSFVPSEAAPSAHHDDRRSSTGSEHSHRSSKSKAKSTHTSASKRSHHSHHHGESSERRSSAPSVHTVNLLPSTAEHPTKAPSIIGSILGRGTSTTGHPEPTAAAAAAQVYESHSDSDSIAPDDSISNAGSHRSRRSHRSSHSRHSTHSTHSKHSKHSSHSEHSKHSKHSKHRSGASAAGGSGPDAVEIVVEEASDTSTVKPAHYPRAATVISMPVRAITQSVIDGRASGKRSVVSYAGGH